MLTKILDQGLLALVLFTLLVFPHIIGSMA